MANKGIKIFFTLSIVFYILVILYLIFGLYNVRSFAEESASVSASRINSSIDSAFSVDHSFSSPYFEQKATEAFAKFDNLKGMIISSDDNGLEYLRFTDPRLIPEFNPDTFRTSKKVPVVNSPDLFVKAYKAKLYFNNSYSVEIMTFFSILDRADIFPILRNTLIVTLLHLVLSIILLSVFNIKKTRPAAAAEIIPPPASGPIYDTMENIPGDFADEEFLSPDSLPAMEPESGDTDIGTEVRRQSESQGYSSGMYSDRSGLVWEHFLSEKLDAELKRAASFDQDSCLVFIQIISPSGYVPYRNISELIIEHFSYKDLAFESGENTFCVIIPDKDIDEGQFEVEKFRKSLIARFPDSSYRIYAGITSRNSRLLSEKRMVQEAKAALAKAASEKESTTIAFRTDLNKYREYIASIT